MPSEQFILKSIEDVEKLAGCQIISAQIIGTKGAKHLELEIGHILIDGTVKLTIKPAVNFTYFEGTMIVAVGLTLNTEDQPPEKIE